MRFLLRLLDLVVPQRFASRLIGMLARTRWPRWILQPFLRFYIRKFKVEIHEASHPLEEYRTFTDFFTRELQPGLRPLHPDPDTLISPVDGTVAAHGPIDGETCLQAKGISYTLAEILDDPDEAKHYLGGSFLTIYLSPRDYHRIHTPFEASVSSFRYVPGKLLPVNPPSVAFFRRLFVENERLTSYLDHPKAGRIALIKVGATFVGRMGLYYHPFFTNRWGRASSQTTELSAPVSFKKGDQLAVFEMGSTVVLLFSSSVRLHDLTLGSAIRLGEPIASLR